MQNRDFLTEHLSDVKNLNDYTLLPGENVSYDVNLVHFGGFMP